MPHTHTDKAADNILTRIEDEARAVALAFGVSTPNDLAAALLDRLRASIGGERLYLPRNDARSREERDAAIRAEFTGHNVGDLAQRHNISRRWVRKIISTTPQKE